MYLHIGNDKIIKKENIIGIFDYEGLKKEETLKKVLEKIQQTCKIEDISQQNPKTMIMVKENDKIKVYLSNISSLTLAKRNRY